MNKEDQVMMGLRELVNKMSWLNKFKMEASLNGFKSSEVHYIEHIARNADSNVTKLAESFYMTRGAISKMTRKLMEKGIIESLGHHQGRRSEVERPANPQARTLLDVRARTGVQIGEAFMVRNHPQWLAVRELVASGRIGDLRVVAGHFAYFKRDPSDVRSVPEWGGGGLMDVGCYPITMSRWLFGEEPEAVIGIVDRDPELRVDRIASGMMRFPSGGQATFTCAMQLVHYQRMQLHGTSGRIEVQIPFNAPNDRPTRVFVDDGRELGDRSAEAIEFPVVDQYTLQGDNFSAAVRGERTVPVSIDDAVGNMAVIDALFRSERSGRWEAPDR
jgi:predicted dehydrogenase